MNCQIYKSSRQADAYLYVRKNTDLDRLPETLRNVFGVPEKVMEMELQPTTKLAQADAITVIQAIREQGYYLQLPPDPYGNKHNPWG